MNIFLFDIVGVLLSSVASIAIGLVWYSHFLFGGIWMRETGLTEEKMRAMSMTPAQAISIAVVLGMLFAVLLNVLFRWIGVHTVAQGTLLAGFCCLTFFGIPLLILSVFEDTSKKAWAINAFYEVALSLAVGAIVAWSILP